MVENGYLFSLAKNICLIIWSFFMFVSQAGSSIPSVSLFVVNLYGPAHTLEMMPLDSLRVRYCTFLNRTRDAPMLT